MERRPERGGYGLGRTVGVAVGLGLGETLPDGVEGVQLHCWVTETVTRTVPGSAVTSEEPVWIARLTTMLPEAPATLIWATDTEPIRLTTSIGPWTVTVGGWTSTEVTP